MPVAVWPILNSHEFSYGLSPISTTSKDQPMNATLTIPRFPPPLSAKLGSLLSLLAELRAAAAALATPDGLKKAVGLLIDVADALGMDAAWTAKLKTLLSDQNVFEVALVIVQFIESLFGSSPPPLPSAAASAGDRVTLDAQAFADWLPVVMQILQVIEQLLGKGTAG